MRALPCALRHTRRLLPITPILICLVPFAQGSDTITAHVQIVAGPEYRTGELPHWHRGSIHDNRVCASIQRIGHQIRGGLYPWQM